MEVKYLVERKPLVDYCTKIFVTNGMQENDAYAVADSLVDADLRGVSSHGIMRIGNYLDRLDNGGAKRNPEIKIISETDTTLLIDADDALGAVVSEKVVSLTREKAKKSGVAIVVVKRSNHHGACAHWSQKIAADDMIGIAITNVEPLIAITGSKVPGIGNNPFSVAFPTKSNEHVCLDIACSIMAGGKLIELRREGKDAPEGAFLDEEGNPTTDAHKGRTMRPFGGHKGYGIAVVVEMLTSVLSGGNFGYDMGSQYRKLSVPNHIAHFFMAIDIERFRNLDEFKEDADNFVDYLRELPKSEGVERIYFPGEIENGKKKCNLENGIPYTQSALEELESFGKRVGLAKEESSFLWEKK
ncbi:MAG: Ldh family oxidoreductase [Christensenellaceae bacterium]|nr:Ldh family oxidoreductase [Christensenellaceae bacterium]